MEEPIRALHIDVAACRIMLNSLWANVIANGGGDPVAAAARAHKEAVASITRDIPADATDEVRAATHDLLASIDENWREIERLVAIHKRVART